MLKRSLLPPTPVRLPQAEHESLASNSGVSKYAAKQASTKCRVFSTSALFSLPNLSIMLLLDFNGESSVTAGSEFHTLHSCGVHCVYLHSMDACSALPIV